MNFARENNLRLTRAINDIVVHAAFIGHGCSGDQTPQPAVTVGVAGLVLR
jgi:hypothetical protein